MSSALAIAAVSACLKDLLNDGLIDHDLTALGSFSVTAQPPDRVSAGPAETNQLNLFLYQVTPNLGWRNRALPSRDSRGVRVSNPPLALDLHYLLTAYGASDLNAEVLLGYAMQLLHESPVLTRQQLRRALSPSPLDGVTLPGPFGTLSAVNLADQVELLKITPVYLGTEELSKLWASMQARYRPSMAYSVSVVLIQSTDNTRSAPPVLRRGKDDRGVVARGAPSPVLGRIRPEASDSLPALRLGEDLLVTGRNLRARGATLQFRNVRLDIDRELELTVKPLAGAAPQLAARLPSVAEDASGMTGWAIGAYTVAMRLVEPNQPAWLTNCVTVALAPRIELAPRTVPAGNVVLSVKCTPRLRPEQLVDVRLVFGVTVIVARSVDTPANPALPTELTFDIPDVTAGSYLVRLRVDGIDSLPVTSSGAPPVLDLDPLQMVTVT